MKLGLSYILFSGEELLPIGIPPIRHLVDFISIVYQKKSFYGNEMHPELLQNLEQIRPLVDLICEFVPNNKNCRINETAARNFGLELSRKAGCTHHIAADVDEFYEPSGLEYVKKEMEGYNCSLVHSENYYKNLNWFVYPSQNLKTTFIHPVDSFYDMNVPFKYPVDGTRKCNPCDKCRVFDKSEFFIHHMSYVRNDIRRKIVNSVNKFSFDKFVDSFEKYELGKRVCLPPDFINRKTILVENIWSKNK